MNSPIALARLRLALLWLAVFARAVGEHAVRAYGIFRDSDGHAERNLGSLFLWVGMAAVPAFALAPLIGALASSRFRPSVMIAATLLGLGAIAYSSFDESQAGRAFWLACATVLAFEAAFFSACRFSLLPEAARSARSSLPQVMSVFAFATAAGAGIGIWVGVNQFRVGAPGLPVPLQVAHVGYGLALVCVLFARFPAQRPIGVHDGLIKPFLKTARAIFRTRNGRNALLALWGIFGIALVVDQLLYQRHDQPTFFLFLAVGIAAGGLHGHPYRTLAAVPFASVGLAFSTVCGFVTNNWFEPALAMAFFLGSMIAPLLTVFAVYQPESSRGHGAALLHAGWSAIIGAFFFVLIRFLADQRAAWSLFENSVLALSLFGALFAWTVFFRPAVEATVEAVLWPLYRIKALGPSAQDMPWRGPLLVIGNHSSWFDPFWLAKVLTLPVAPMMTSRFYDLPFISWMMRRVVCAIRVPDVRIRKEAPELKEAIAALDRGECVVVFPEGWLRRKDEQELRRFGRGIWQILKARPNVPIMPCWIEGGWGSMVSHKNGPPLKKKKWDFRRPIRIAMGALVTLDAATLRTHMTTRSRLMKAVLESRALLGLPAIAVDMHVPETDDDKPPDDKPEGGA
jgi:1-acyl-sn-glycerol-3-phosphate acyltransferase